MKTDTPGEGIRALPHAASEPCAKRLPIGLWLLIVGAAFACQNGTPERSDATTPHSSASETPVTATPSDSLRLWLDVSAEVRAGEPVPITLRAENITERSRDLYLTGRTIAFDLTVTNEDGAVIWRRLEDEVIPAILRLETLEPGETLSLDDTWEQRSNDGEPVAPGTYTVRGEILTEEEPLVTPEVALRITGG